MKAKSFVVCILFLDSLHTGLGHQVPKEKTLKEGSHTNKDEDCYMRFMHCLQKCCVSCKNAQDVQPMGRRRRRRKRRWRRRFSKKVGVVPPANCPVNDLSVWCKRSPCNAPAWAEAGVGRKEGREKKLVDRGIFNDPQGEVTMAQADMRYLGAGSLPPPPSPPILLPVRCSHPLALSKRKHPKAQLINKELVTAQLGTIRVLEEF